MASRYFQGRVIETNEPCYISWDTESRCSKIQSLIELKLEAPDVSKDHECHKDWEEALWQKNSRFNGLPSAFGFIWTFVFSNFMCIYRHKLLCSLAFRDFQDSPSQSKNGGKIKTKQSLFNPYMVHSSINFIISGWTPPSFIMYPWWY